jgi:hypothetical protein
LSVATALIQVDVLIITVTYYTFLSVVISFYILWRKNFVRVVKDGNYTAALSSGFETMNKKTSETQIEQDAFFAELEDGANSQLLDSEKRKQEVTEILNEIGINIDE